MSKKKTQVNIEGVKAMIIEGINKAKCHTASFGDIHGKKLYFNDEVWCVDDFVKDRIRLYMDSWVVGPLKEALQHIENPEHQIDWGIDGKSLIEDKRPEYGPCDDNEIFIMHRTIPVNVTDNSETQAIVTIEKIIELLPQDARCRVLDYMRAREYKTGE